ncbi:uncharacterized protein LOC113109002 isoform X2 [Carassius auratus]|uniref:Uncharacterized protein LOC113092607 isoform X2 n=1 Tax=Carassius auratus TaxID=7957 RepID=A0A6P6PJZ8_CARAU|nr:uncharacterized protein LOC113092607 isoform X2 [Carassius auratus]XP_026121019.1 uncharacterized protein LOC113100545 isoform X2 [Carassius auratus]XP_026128249.1 uncharacterized protein LOC113109002 isoform X2 [Carassius auratus]
MRNQRAKVQQGNECTSSRQFLTMDGLDEVAICTLKAANIGEDILPTLTRDDIRDLFPGPEHFLRRKAIWLIVHKEEQEHTIPVEPQGSSADDEHNGSPKRDDPSTSKFLKLPSPEYVLFTDSELQHVRRAYFEQQRLGKEGEVTLSKELFCRLIRNTMTNMISIARASSDDYKYPTKHEVIAMAKRLVEYYPMIKDKSTGSSHEWDTVAKKLLKRLSNIRSPVKAKHPPSKRVRLNEVPSAAVASDYDADSSASTVHLSPPSRSSTPQQENDSIDEASDGPDNSLDSQKTQARHYRTLQEMYKAKKPNKAAVTHLLDLEFQSRRNFIDSNALKEQDRPTKILQAYPCFKELDHVMDELRRVIEPNNSQYTSEVKGRWENFYSKVQFYGVMKKVMKPPRTLNGVEHAIAVFTALPLLFPSGSAAPKKLVPISEALFHVLTPSEDPDTYIHRRVLSSPVLLIGEQNCIVVVGTTPVVTFEKDLLYEGPLYLLAYYYAFHLTYPKCIATLLSVLQTQVLGDVIHEQDATSSYKKAIHEWKMFVE